MPVILYTSYLLKLTRCFSGQEGMQYQTNSNPELQPLHKIHDMEERNTWIVAFMYELIFQNLL